MAESKRFELKNGVLGYSREMTPAAVAPQAHTQVRRFKAARPGRLVGGFSGLMANSPREEVRQDLRGLISHSRHAAQNIDHLKSYEMMVRRHVVGRSGISLQMDAKNQDGKPDHLANTALETAWKKWGLRGNCTPCGRLSWWQIEKIAATMLAREGNFMLREWRGRSFGDFQYQVQPLSIDLLDLDMMQTLKDGAYIDGGVEFNAFGRPIAFHFFDGHPAEAHTGRGRNRIRVPADQVVQVLRHTETGQALGVPESHTALRRLNMLSKYEESALIAAHYGASAMVFLEQDVDGTPNPAPTDDLDEELPEEMEAGQVVELPPGYRANANPSNYPDANMPGFMKTMGRGASAGLGVSYAGLTSDMEGSSFSSLKDGRSEERDEWRVWQRDLWEGLHNEVFKSWVPSALLAGKAVLPTGRPIPATSVDKFVDAATWRGRGWKSVNPKDDAVANDKNLQNRLTTPSDVVAEDGQDFGQVATRFARDLETLKAAGVPISASLAGTPSPSEPDPNEPEDGPPDPEKG